MSPRRPRLLAVVALLAALAALVVVPSSSVASDALSCTFQSTTYPKLGRHSKPGNRYAVFIRRALTCDEARAVARRGTKTENPGPFSPFQMRGGWSCLSWAPGFVGTVIAGQCTKPGSRALVNWSPVCAPRDNACNNLRR